uniref:BAR domain-containing protein n=1 Tax=Steinernema glaseri TaxID=37863 RepID=A0A1I7Y4A5_9BILA
MAGIQSVHGTIERSRKAASQERESSSEYPPEFEQEIAQLKAFHSVAENVVSSIASYIRVIEPSPPHPPQMMQSELKQLSSVLDKASQNQFLDEPVALLPIISTMSDVTTALARKENAVNQEIYERVWKPLKSWLDEDYPRINRELKKCFEMHGEATSAMADAQRRPARASKAETMKERYEKQFKLCQKELDMMKMVQKHQYTCLKLLLDLQYDLHSYCEKELDKACAAMATAYGRLPQAKEDL